MKHLSFILVILVVCTLTTACVNNLAVKELNNNAKDFMNKGDVNSAICRLKSSIDLDSSIWETHYHLALAYTEANDFKNAQNEFFKVSELNPDFVDNYYSLAVCYEKEVEALKDKFQKDDDKKNVDLPTADIVQKLLEATKNYELYIQKTNQTDDIDNIQERITSIKSEIEEYNTDED